MTQADSQTAFVETVVSRCRSTWLREGLSGPEIDKKELWLRERLKAAEQYDEVFGSEDDDSE
jgi:hypothetical protein